MNLPSVTTGWRTAKDERCQELLEVSCAAARYVPGPPHERLITPVADNVITRCRISSKGVVRRHAQFRKK